MDSALQPRTKCRRSFQRATSRHPYVLSLPVVSVIRPTRGPPVPTVLQEIFHAQNVLTAVGTACVTTQRAGARATLASLAALAISWILRQHAQVAALETASVSTVGHKRIAPASWDGEVKHATSPCALWEIMVVCALGRACAWL